MTKITFDKQREVFNTLGSKQFDSSEPFKAEFLNNGEPIDLSQYNIRFECKKPDGNIVVDDENITIKNICEIEMYLNEQVTVVNGKVDCQFVLVNKINEKQTSTFTFYMDIQQSVLGINGYSRSVITIAERLARDIIKAGNLHNDLTEDIAVATPLQQSLRTDINEANTFRGQFNQDVATGVLIKDEIRQNTIDATNVNAELLHSKELAQSSVDTIRGTGNYYKIILPTDWVGTEPNLTYSWNHGLKTKNISVDVFDEVTGETLFWSVTANDIDNASIQSKTRRHLRVVLSAKYYSGGMDSKEKIDEVGVELTKVNASLEQIEQKQKVSITDFGAVGDGVVNDYEAFINACNAVGKDGVLYFPKTLTNKYFFHTGLSGSGMRIKMEGKPIFEFENPNTILRYEYDPDLKFLRTKTPFILSNHWETITRKIDTNFIEDKIQKVGSKKKNSNQKLSKLSFLTDFTLENYNGNSWSSNTTNNKTENELTFTGGSGYCLATRKNEIGDYIEMLFVRNSVIATNGHYDITVTTDVGTYAIQFNAIVKAISVGKFVSGQYTTIVASLPIQEQCFLKDSGSVLLGINRLSNYAFDIIANGVFIYRLIVADGETVSKVGFGNTSSNNINTTMKFPIESQNYINMNYQTRNLFSFGDSITFGAYSFKDYPQIIGDMLYQEKGFKSLNVYNYGVSGDNSAQCLTRINAHLGEITGKDIVTVQIGTNDCQGKLYLDTFKTNLISIIDKLKLNTNLILMSTFPLYDKTITNYENIGAYNSVIKQVCIEKNILCVDNNSNFGGNIDLLPDKIHPNEEGYLILAKGFVDGIYNLVNL